MAAKSATALLTGYFNQGDGKRTNSEWLKELKALSPEEKLELAQGVAAITGDEVK